MADVEDLERHLGHRLPDDYRLFLRSHNGGRPNPDYVVTGTPHDPIQHVNYLNGVTDEIESCTLLWNYQVMRERLRPDLLPIGDNGCGDQFCLVLVGPDRGKIVYWDCREAWVRPPPDPLDVYPVADSFAEFLNALFDHDPLADQDTK
jgi:hypothetical protein